jgi:hypothetical protein
LFRDLVTNSSVGPGNRELLGGSLRPGYRRGQPLGLPILENGNSFGAVSGPLDGFGCDNPASSHGLQSPQDGGSAPAGCRERGCRAPCNRRPGACVDAERLIAAWNDRQAKRMPMLFSPTIGAAITAGYWFLWVRCPACRTTNAIDLRALDRHCDAAVTSLIPALSCHSCRPNAPFAELVRLSRTSIADENAGRAPAKSSRRRTIGVPRL